MVNPPAHSYFAGCSTGGREGMLASARYPQEFDGIVSGDPAMRTGNSNIGLAWANAAFTEIAPRDESGKPDPTKAFSASDRKLITDAILNACDAKDGIKDGMIFDGQACQFDPAALACSGAKTDRCLSSQQVGALKKAFAGPKNSRGAQVYPAFPWDSGVAAEGVRNSRRSWPRGAHSPVGPPNRESINVDAARGHGRRGRDGAPDQYRLLDQSHRAFSATAARSCSITAGAIRGSRRSIRSIITSAWPGIPEAWQQVREKSSRFYAVPGMGHCSSGPAHARSFRSFSARWSIGSSRARRRTRWSQPVRAFPGRSRPLCAYPQHAQYKGQGDPGKRCQLRMPPVKSFRTSRWELR